jgi:hypothetical protein
MAQSGEGKPRVFIVRAPEALLSTGGIKPMRSEPRSMGVLLGIGSAPADNLSLGKVA